jgi:hypothetical protein
LEAFRDIIFSFYLHLEGSMRFGLSASFAIAPLALTVHDPLLCVWFVFPHLA